MKPLNILLLVDAPEHFGSRVRGSWPLEALMQAGVARVAHHKWPGSDGADADGFLRDLDLATKNEIAFSKEFIRDLMACDVIVLPQASSSAWYGYIRFWQDRGKVVVMDCDDDSFNVHPTSPSFAIRSESEADLRVNGEVILKWRDRARYDPDSDERLAKEKPPTFLMNLSRNQMMMARYRKALSECDAITTTTERAKQRFLDFNANVFVLPNSVDTDLYIPGRHPGRQGFRVLWYGGNSHEGDVIEAAKGLARFMDETPDAVAVIAGQACAAIVKQVPAERLEFWEWTCADAHPWRLMGLGADLGFCAVEEGTAFNACKSALKWTEMGALGIPAICTDAPPYSGIVKNGADGWLVPNHAEDWYNAFRRFYADKSLRERIGSCARARMVKDFDICRNAGLWYSCYRSLVDARHRIVMPEGVA